MSVRENASTRSNEPEQNTVSTDTPSTSSGNPPLPKAKISAFARFKMLTTSGFKSSSPDPAFPPTSWELSESPESGSGASDWYQKADQYKAGLDKWREQVSAITLNDQADKKDNENTSAEDGDASTSTRDIDQDLPDSRTLAMRIKSLIDEKFTFGAPKSTQGASLNSSAPASGATTPSAEKHNSSGSMFGGLDVTLAKLLSTESIMNGEVGKGLEKGRESVWAMLDKLGEMAGATDPSSNKSSGAVDKGKGRATVHDRPIEPLTAGTEDDGIMMYTPLQPTKDLEPEIAESEVSYVEDDEQADGSSTPTQLKFPAEPATSPVTPRPAKKPAPVPKRKFYPSSTKLSLQVTWWGYRIFLPPPIIAQLSSAHIAAAKRGAMITAALKWIIDQVPMMVIPPQLRPGVLMLKRVSPYLGYVGAFVAWSWGRVQANDQGQGVVLTATWLLPIAILPASWNFEAHGRPRDMDGALPPNNESTAANITRVVSTEPPDGETRNSSQTAGAEVHSQGNGSKPATPSTDKPGLLSSASRRWKSLTRNASTEEKD